MFIDMLSNSDDRILILREIEEYEEMFKSLIELSISSEIENTWIFLVSYYYFYVLEFYDKKLLKDKMPFFLRHGLISIMPLSLKEKMEQIQLNNKKIRSESMLHFNNYLYYLFYTRNYNDKIVMLQYNYSKKFILAPHESNSFEITLPINSDTILYFEYRFLSIDTDLLVPEIINSSESSAASAAISSDLTSKQIYLSISKQIIDIINFDLVEVYSDPQPSKISSQISSENQETAFSDSKILTLSPKEIEPSSVQLSGVVVAHPPDEIPQQSQYDFDIIYDEINRDIVKLRHKTQIETTINEFNSDDEPNMEDNDDYLDKVLIILNQIIEDRSVEEPATAAAARSGGYLNNLFHHCY